MPTTNQGRPFFTNFFAAFRAHSALQKSSSTPASVALATSISNNLLPQVTSAVHHNHATSSGAQRTITTKRSTSSISSSSSGSSNLALSPPTSTPAASFRASRPVQQSYPAHGTPQGRGRIEPAPRRHYNSPSPEPNHCTTLPLPLALPPTSCSSTSPAASTSPIQYGPTPFSQRSRTPSLTRQRTRRESDCSSEGGFPLSPSYKSRESAATTWDMSAGASAAAVPEKWYIGGRTAQGDERFYKLGLVKRYGSEDRLSLDRLSL